VFSATKKSKGKAVWFDWTKAERRVSCYYFYILDREFGPAFIKICTYFPYPTKVWLNGHEWAKRQATRAGITFKELANGFAGCGAPEALQAVCDRLGPADIETFFDYWTERIPTPFTAADRAAGYWWELSMRQVEVSRTLVLDDPRRARSFFESLVADNIAVGRPDQVAMVFARRVGKYTKEPFVGRVFSPGTEVKMDSRTSTAGSSNTSKKGGRCVSRPSSTNPGTSRSAPVSSICPSWSPRPARSTNVCL
jgi:hypothetical protein